MRPHEPELRGKILAGNGGFWSGRRDLNPGPLAPQTRACAEKNRPVFNYLQVKELPCAYWDLWNRVELWGSRQLHFHLQHTPGEVSRKGDLIENLHARLLSQQSAQTRPAPDSRRLGSRARWRVVDFGGTMRLLAATESSTFGTPGQRLPTRAACAVRSFELKDRAHSRFVVLWGFHNRKAAWLNGRYAVLKGAYGLSTRCGRDCSNSSLKRRYSSPSSVIWTYRLRSNVLSVPSRSLMDSMP